MKRRLSRLVSTRRSTVLSLPLQKVFPVCAINIKQDASRSIIDNSIVTLQVVASLLQLLR
jgi:hypothetical protein